MDEDQKAAERVRAAVAELNDAIESASMRRISVGIEQIGTLGRLGGVEYTLYSAAVCKRI